MYKRIKIIREVEKLNQTEFAKRLGIGQSTLGMMEVGKRDIADRHVKAICSIFNINEDWFRTGQGEMYDNSKKVFIEKLTKQMELNPMLQDILESYLSMSEEKRAFVDAFFKTLEMTVENNSRNPVVS